MIKAILLPIAVAAATFLASPAMAQLEVYTINVSASNFEPLFSGPDPGSPISSFAAEYTIDFDPTVDIAAHNFGGAGYLKEDFISPADLAIVNPPWGVTRDGLAIGPAIAGEGACALEDFSGLGGGGYCVQIGYDPHKAFNPQSATVYYDDFPFAYSSYGVVSLVSPAPESATWLLMIAGICGIGLVLRQAKSKTGLAQLNGT